MERLLPGLFQPVEPQPDCEAIAECQERLIINFSIRWSPGEQVDTRVAAVGVITAGWVIGVKRLS